MQSRLLPSLLLLCVIATACGDDDTAQVTSAATVATTTAPTTTAATTTTTTTTTTVATTTTTTEPATTTTTEPATTTTRPAFPGFSMQPELVEPGVYQPVQKATPLYTVTLDAPTTAVRHSDNAGFWIDPAPDWQNRNIPTVQFGRLIRLFVHDADGNASLVDAPLADPVATLTESAYLEVGEPVTFEVDGYPAIEVRVDVAAGATGFELAAAPGYTARAITDAIILTFIDVGGDQLLFAVYAPSEAIEEAAAFGRAILETIDFIG